MRGLKEKGLFNKLDVKFSEYEGYIGDDNLLRMCLEKMRVFRLVKMPSIRLKKLFGDKLRVILELQ